MLLHLLLQDLHVRILQVRIQIKVLVVIHLLIVELLLPQLEEEVSIKVQDLIKV